MTIEEKIRTLENAAIAIENGCDHVSNAKGYQIAKVCKSCIALAADVRRISADISIGAGTALIMDAKIKESMLSSVIAAANALQHIAKCVEQPKPILKLCTYASKKKPGFFCSLEAGHAGKHKCDR
jgi:hypothetical protein